MSAPFKFSAAVAATVQQTVVKGILAFIFISSQGFL